MVEDRGGLADATGIEGGLQDAIDRIRSRWGVRGVVRGSGLALSGRRARDAATPAASSPAPAPS
jgi:hypothetical protein